MTKLRIASPRLFAAVHHVFDRLPPHVQQRLGTMKLLYISDERHPQLAGTLGVCLRWDDGQQAIHLSPDLANYDEHTIRLVVGHELGHACQGSIRGGGFDEAFAVAFTDDWVPSPYPRIDWKMGR